MIRQLTLLNLFNIIIASSVPLINFNYGKEIDPNDINYKLLHKYRKTNIDGDEYNIPENWSSNTDWITSTFEKHQSNGPPLDDTWKLKNDQNYSLGEKRPVTLDEFVRLKNNKVNKTFKRKPSENEISLDKAYILNNIVEIWGDLLFPNLVKTRNDDVAQKYLKKIFFDTLKPFLHKMEEIPDRSDPKNEILYLSNGRWIYLYDSDLIEYKVLNKITNAYNELIQRLNEIAGKDRQKAFVYYDKKGHPITTLKQLSETLLKEILDVIVLPKNTNHLNNYQSMPKIHDKQYRKASIIKDKNKGKESKEDDDDKEEKPISSIKNFANKIKKRFLQMLNGAKERNLAEDQNPWTQGQTKENIRWLKPEKLYENQVSLGSDIPDSAIQDLSRTFAAIIRDFIKKYCSNSRLEQIFIQKGIINPQKTYKKEYFPLYSNNQAKRKNNPINDNEQSFSFHPGYNDKKLYFPTNLRHHIFLNNNEKNTVNINGIPVTTSHGHTGNYFPHKLMMDEIPINTQYMNKKFPNFPRYDKNYGYNIVPPQYGVKGLPFFQHRRYPYYPVNNDKYYPRHDINMHGFPFDLKYDNYRKFPPPVIQNRNYNKKRNPFQPGHGHWTQGVPDYKYPGKAGLNSFLLEGWRKNIPTDRICGMPALSSVNNRKAMVNQKPDVHNDDDLDEDDDQTYVFLPKVINAPQIVPTIPTPPFITQTGTVPIRPLTGFGNLPRRENKKPKQYVIVHPNVPSSPMKEFENFPRNIQKSGQLGYVLPKVPTTPEKQFDNFPRNIQKSGQLGYVHPKVPTTPEKQFDNFPRDIQKPGQVGYLLPKVPSTTMKEFENFPRDIQKSDEIDYLPPKQPSIYEKEWDNFIRDILKYDKIGSILPKVPSIPKKYENFPTDIQKSNQIDYLLPKAPSTFEEEFRNLSRNIQKSDQIDYLPPKDPSTLEKQFENLPEYNNLSPFNHQHPKEHFARPPFINKKIIQNAKNDNSRANINIIGKNYAVPSEVPQNTYKQMNSLLWDDKNRNNPNFDSLPSSSFDIQQRTPSYEDYLPSPNIRQSPEFRINEDELPETQTKMQPNIDDKQHNEEQNNLLLSDYGLATTSIIPNDDLQVSNEDMDSSNNENKNKSKESENKDDPNNKRTMEVEITYNPIDDITTETTITEIPSSNEIDKRNDIDEKYITEKSTRTNDVLIMKVGSTESSDQEHPIENYSVAKSTTETVESTTNPEETTKNPLAGARRKDSDDYIRSYRPQVESLLYLQKHPNASTEELANKIFHKMPHDLTDYQRYFITEIRKIKKPILATVAYLKEHPKTTDLELLSMLNIEEGGLSFEDLELLSTVRSVFQNKPANINDNLMDTDSSDDNLQKYKTAIGFLKTNEGKTKKEIMEKLFKNKLLQLAKKETELHSNLSFLANEYKRINALYNKELKKDIENEKVVVAVMKIPVKKGAEKESTNKVTQMFYDFKNKYAQQHNITGQAIKIIENDADFYNLTPIEKQTITNKISQQINKIKQMRDSYDFDLQSIMDTLFLITNEILPANYLSSEQKIFESNPYQDQSSNPAEMVINPTQSVAILLNRYEQLLAKYMYGKVHVKKKTMINYLIQILNILVDRIRADPTKMAEDGSQVRVFYSA